MMDDIDGFAGFTDDEITTTKLAEMGNQVFCGEQVDGDNITEWLDCVMHVNWDLRC
jgi:hypothetical protein